MRYVAIAIGLGLTAAPLAAEATTEVTDAAQIDYPAFVSLAADVADYREERLIRFDAFIAMSDQPNVLLLDSRSAAAFERGHIEGAVNLPFSDFTEEKLAKVIGADRDRPILIYCNNNFSDDAGSVRLKSPPLTLNIPTFINLVGYGYSNVWELDDRVSVRDPATRWTGTELRDGAARFE